jgi:cobalt/nickel transport system permease protein
MTYSSLSNHIPDLNLITWYAENGRSAFHGASPWTKLVVLVLLVIFITVIKSILVLMLLYGAILLLYAGAGLPVRKLAAWYTLPLIFVFSLVGILMWSEPGVPLFAVGGLTLTDNALRLVVTLTVKTLTSVTYTLTFLMTTKYNYLSAMVYRIFPRPIDQIFMMSYRFLFLTLQTIDALLKSIGARGGGLVRSMRRQGKMFAEVFALVFIRSYDRADRVTKAMESRGFAHKYMALTPLPPVRAADAIFLVIAGSVVVFVTVTGTVIPGGIP